MKSVTILAAIVFADAAAAATCNADNCARAVTGTFRQLTATHRSDCASFMACTVTPAAVTSTAATTVTLAVTAPATTVTGDSYNENANKRAVTSVSAAAAAATALTNCPSAVPSYASACSGTARYSSACSCNGVTRATITMTTSTVLVTPTVTTTLSPSVVSVSPSAPPLCNNAGLEWAYQRDTQPDYDQADTLAYDPTVNKQYTPLATGATNYLHYLWTEGNFYGQSLSNDFFTLEHRGYLFAPESGTYTFSVENVDNNWFLWLGPTAYSGWTKDNALQNVYLDLTNGYYGQPGGSGTYTTNLTAGKYYPIRLVYHNDRGPGSFDYTITAPSGYQLIGPSSSSARNTPFVVQFSCDGVLAPRFQPYGQET